MKTILIIALAIILILGVIFFLKKDTDEDNSAEVLESDGLIVETIEAGDGQKVEDGDTIVVHYKGTLEDGTVFDSSYSRGNPFSFVVGSGMVIEGWDKGLLNAKEGEVLKLTIPSSMAYGPSGRGTIPPNATLIFEIEVLEVKKQD